MSKTKKIISVVLAVALVMAMATVAMVSASASTKVYFDNSNGWGSVNAYCFGGDGEMFGAWPGAACTDEGNGVWSIEMTGTPEAIIFNDNAGNQTSNIVYEGTGKIAKLTGNQVQGDFQMVDEAVWEDYAVDVVETTAATVETTAAEVTTTAAAVETTVAEVETTAAAVETTVVTEPAEVETTVAASDDEVETTVAASDDEVETTAATVETTVVTEPVETTAATVETTAAAPETTAATVETTAATVETTAATVETTAATVETTAATVETTAAAEANGIVVGGVEYTAQVGDIITYTANLTTPKAIENIQAVTTYDASKLKLVSDATTMFPNMLGVVANPQEGEINFNASEITKGFDFTAGQVLITLQFEVLDNTYSEITTTIQEMVEFFGGDYITGGEIVADGVVFTETLEVPVVEGDSSSTATEEVTTTAAPTEEKTDATSATEDEKKPAADVVPTGVAATIYVVLAVLAMAAAAVVVLRKKVNG